MPTQDPAAAIYAQMEATVRQMQDIRAEMKAKNLNTSSTTAP